MSADLYCLTCSCHEECCDCYEVDKQLVEAHYCESCGTICSDDDLDAHGYCYECEDD